MLAERVIIIIASVIVIIIIYTTTYDHTEHKTDTL